jgi:hypothetical protein
VVVVRGRFGPLQEILLPSMLQYHLALKATDPDAACSLSPELTSELLGLLLLTQGKVPREGPLALAEDFYDYTLNQDVAFPEGIEPTSSGVKVRCLTTRPRELTLRSVRARPPPSGWRSTPAGEAEPRPACRWRERSA